MRARRQKSGRVWYYFDTGEKPRREIPLGDDYVLAVEQWSKLSLHVGPSLKTVGWAITRYLASPDYARLAAGTQADYRFALDQLAEKFADAPLDQVRASHVTLYMEDRARESEHRAQRERSILSMIFRWAMARDWCRYNPVAAIKGRRLPGRRSIDISDAQYDAVYEASGQPLRDAIDLAYLTGQRPGDVLRLAESDIRDGRPLSKAQLRSRFEAARSAAGITGDDFQFRDLRRKAGADLRDQAGLDAAQSLLGHRSVTMTEHYTGGRGKVRSVLPKRGEN